MDFPNRNYEVDRRKYNFLPIKDVFHVNYYPFKCHGEVLYFQLLIPPKRFDIFSPRLGDAQKV